MEKRLAIALLLSFVVLVAYELLFSKPTPPPVRPQTIETPSQAEPPSSVASPSSTAKKSESPEPADLTPRVEDTTEQSLTLSIGKPGEVGSYRASFSNRGARLTELRSGNFFVSEKIKGDERLDPNNWTTLISSPKSAGKETGSLTLRSVGVDVAYEREPLDRALWTMRESDDHLGVDFELAPGRGLHFKKRVRFEPSTYRIRIELELQNDGFDAAKIATFRFTPAEVMPPESGDSFYQEPQAVAAGRAAQSKDYEDAEFQGEPRDPSGRSLEEPFKVPTAPLCFAGVINKYFAVVLRPSEPHSQASMTGAIWRRLRDDAWAAESPKNAEAPWRFMATDVVLSLAVPERGKSTTWSYTLFAGPKDRAVLAAESPDFEAISKHDMGFFNRIARVLVAVLNFFHAITANWGIAIILLTFSVRLLLFPINRKSQTSMARYQKKMKRVQPQIDELKKRYANDPSKLRTEQGELMRREGLMPPLGGCLPMFVQIPVFFGLFSALRTSFDLRQAPFALWITDLAKPDRLMQINWTLPFFGKVEYLNILPPLMVVLWVLQQMLMPKPADEQQARMQKMMMFMPIMMGFFLYNYAAGLSLYMITQSTLGIVETTVIKKYWPIDDNEKQVTKTGFLARIATLHEEQQRKLKGKQQPKGRDQGRGGSTAKKR